MVVYVVLPLPVWGICLHRNLRFHVGCQASYALHSKQDQVTNCSLFRLEWHVETGLRNCENGAPSCWITSRQTQTPWIKTVDSGEILDYRARDQVTHYERC